MMHGQKNIKSLNTVTPKHLRESTVSQITYRPTLCLHSFRWVLVSCQNECPYSPPFHVQDGLRQFNL
jgi:hypothetical protein